MPCVIRDNAKAIAANDKTRRYKAAWLRFSYVKENEMKSSQVVIDAEIKTALQDLFPFKIMESDLPYIVDLFLTLGMVTMKSALQKHPELTIGDFITMFYRLHQH